jgi:sugar phosphate isomerase/epimerase
VIRVAFNNLGFQHLEAAASSREAGPVGFLQAAVDLGFSAFQYTTGGMQDAAELEVFDLDRVGETALRLGVPMSLHHHAFFPLPTVPHFLYRDDWYRRLTVYLKTGVDLVRATGGDLVTFHPPQNLREQDLERGGPDPDTRRRSMEAFDEVVREVGAYAEQRGALLGIEAICFPERYPGGTVVKTMEEFDRFLSAPGMPGAVGLQVDVTHFHHKGQDVAAVLEHWRTRLWDVHTSDCVIHDWHGAESYVARMLDEVHWPVGRGTVEFLRIIKTLKRIG